MKMTHLLTRLFLFLILNLMAVGALGAGGPGNALNFSGGGPGIPVPHDATLNAYPITITAWIQTTQPGQGGIVTKASIPGTEGWQVYVEFGTLRAIYQAASSSVGSSGSPLSAASITDGLWHHVAFTVDASGGRLYVDGVQKDSRAWTGTPAAMTATPDVYLGSFASGGGIYGYNGNLDEVTIWNVALTQSQIQTNMNRSLTGNESGLLAYYRCDESNGALTLRDSAPLDGTNNGAVPGNVGFGSSGVRPFTALVETLPATGFNGSGSVFNGVANPEGTNTWVGFQWGTTTNFGNVTAPQSVGSGTNNTNFSQAVAGLTPGLYYFRATASNSLGVVVGTNQTADVPVFSDAGFNLPGISFGNLEWGDYDNDGRLDLLIVGRATNGWITQIWRNTGNSFSNINAGFGITNGTGHWVDYDNDGRLDVFLAGNLLNGIWRNTGAGFSNVITFPDPGGTAAQVTFLDYDNDGRRDLLLAAHDRTDIWRNSKDGFYTPTQTPFPGFLPVEPIVSVDYDNDGRSDLFISGLVLNLRRNGTENSDAVFSDVTVPWSTQGAGADALSWGDFNNDGWEDFMFAGRTNGSGPAQVVQLWQNTGSGFVNVMDRRDIVGTALALDDFDSDGKLDFVISGDLTNIYQNYVTELWRNTGNGFTNINAGLFPGLRFVSVAWGDYDNDGRPDLIIAGATNNFPSGTFFTKIYHNNSVGSNTPPTAPTGLTFTAVGNEVGFAWNPATDAQTPSAGLTYNLRVGTAPGAGDIMTPNSAANGFRRIVGEGNAGHNLFFPLRNLPVNQPLYASVQAVDASFAGSPFSPEKAFGYNLQVTPPTGAVPGDSDGDGMVSQSELDAVLANYWPYTPWLQMTNVAGLGGTNVAFTLNNSTAGAFSVEYSTNLSNWIYLGPATPRYLFTDTNAPVAPQRYYRLRWP
jgi:hypothetical protein